MDARGCGKIFIAMPLAVGAARWYDTKKKLERPMEAAWRFGL
jgi:hypothetical protein